MATSILKGLVVKKSANKTVAVLLTRRKKIRKYHAYVTRSKKYLVHDENNIANVGDNVSFKYFRPISKNKSYILV